MPVLAGLLLVLAWLAWLVSLAVVLVVPVLAWLALALLEMAPLKRGPALLVLALRRRRREKLNTWLSTSSRSIHAT